MTFFEKLEFAEHGPEADEDERDAEYLSHIKESGSVVGATLHLFEELYEEAEEEDGCEA